MVTPLQQAVFWFERDPNVVTGTMVSIDMTIACQVDFAQQKEQVLRYDGAWSIADKFSKRTRV